MNRNRKKEFLDFCREFPAVSHICEELLPGCSNFLDMVDVVDWEVKRASEGYMLRGGQLIGNVHTLQYPIGASVIGNTLFHPTNERWRGTRTHSVYCSKKKHDNEVLEPAFTTASHTWNYWADRFLVKDLFSTTDPEEVGYLVDVKLTKWRQGDKLVCCDVKFTVYKRPAGSTQSSEDALRRLSRCASFRDHAELWFGPDDSDSTAKLKCEYACVYLMLAEASFAPARQPLEALSQELHTWAVTSGLLHMLEHGRALGADQLSGSFGGMEIFASCSPVPTVTIINAKARVGFDGYFHYLPKLSLQLQDLSSSGPLARFGSMRATLAEAEFMVRSFMDGWNASAVPVLERLRKG